MKHTARFVFMVAILLLIGTSPGRARAEVLSLQEAFRRADANAYANRIAGAETEVADAGKTSALQGILPTVRAEAGWVRTNDPLNTFGFLLRQREVTMADFDPARLNDPDPRSNITTGIVVEQPIFNADAWIGRGAAGAAADASRASAEWTKESTRFDVVQAYFGAMLAVEKVATLEEALRSAQGHVRQAESMAANGLVTRSDVLLAAVKAGEVEAALSQARGDAALANRKLATLLGAPAGTEFDLPASLPDAAAVRTALGQDGPAAAERRADVRAAESGADAARRDGDRARSLYAPRVNSFARIDWNAPDAFFDREPAWTLGVIATWTPFAGASQLAEVRAARGRSKAASAGAEAARAQAAVQAAEAETGVAVAAEQLAIAERSVEQAREAHRIVSRKYDGGIATVVELLDAAAGETRGDLGFAHARYQAVIAEANRRLTAGQDLSAFFVTGGPQ